LPAAILSAKLTALPYPLTMWAPSQRRRHLRPRLGWKNKFGKALERHIGSGLEVTDHDSYPVEQQLLHQLVSYEWELTKSPPARISGDRRMAWATVPCGCARSVKASRSFHADDGPRIAVRPCLRKDFTASTSIRISSQTRLPGVVQADTPRHGPDRALSRPLVPKNSCHGKTPSRVNHPLIGSRTLLL